jgi:uncharacterized protein
MKMNNWLLKLFFITCMTLSSIAWTQAPIPPTPTSSIYVQDYANVLTPENSELINSIGSQLAANTKAQVVVVTIKTLQNTPIETLSLGILRKWGIGDKKLNNGVLMLVAVNDRKMRLEVGYGLEGALPDAKAGRIQDEYILPYFKQGDYNKGILMGFLAITQEVAKEYKYDLKTTVQPERVQNSPKGTSNQVPLPWWMQLLIVIIIVVLLIIDWVYFNGMFTLLLISMFRGGRGGGRGGSSGGGFGGGSGGGGGSSRSW